MEIYRQYTLNTPILEINELIESPFAGCAIRIGCERNNLVTFRDFMSTPIDEFRCFRGIGNKAIIKIQKFKDKYRELYEDLLVKEKEKQKQIEQNVDWETRRYNLAKEVMLTLINKDFGSAENIQAVIKEVGDLYKFHSSLAVKYADALIEELRKEE